MRPGQYIGQPGADRGGLREPRAAVLRASKGGAARSRSHGPVSRRARCGAWAVWLCAAALLPGGCNSPYAESEEQANTLYRTFTREPETLDPARAYGGTAYELLCHVVEPPFQYHFLKRPYALEPLTATAMPKLEKRTVSWQGKTIEATVYRVHIKRGIRYHDHPCFVPANHRLRPEDVRDVRQVWDVKGAASRELVAADYVYGVRRLADPRVLCPILPTLKQNILGLREYGDALEAALQEERRKREVAAGAAYNRKQDEVLDPVRLDYGAYPLPGAREVDSHTFEIVLKQPYPQILYWMALPLFAPVPKEAPDFYNQRVLLERSITFARNPVGTGPYRLAEIDPTNQFVLERNPGFRKELYPSLPRPAASDAKGLAVYEALRAEGMLADAGRRLPMVDRIVLRMEKEWIPRWNKFRQGYYDTSDISSDMFDQAVTLTSHGDPGLSEEMSAQGIRLLTSPIPVVSYFAFNMSDPVVGGYTPDKRKLRQAISIAFDVEEDVLIFQNGRATPAHSPIPPEIYGYEEGLAGMNPMVYRWDASRGRAERRSLDEAKRLLAEAGYPNGYTAGGRQLVIRFDNAWVSTSLRPRLKFVVKQFQKLGIRLDIRTTIDSYYWEKLRASNFQFVSLGWMADYPDAENFFFLLYGKNAIDQDGMENVSNYANPEFDRLFEQMRNMENTPHRLEIIRRMNRILQADAPWLFGYHPSSYSLVHKWCRNAYPNTMASNRLKYSRIDVDLRAERRRAWNRPRWGLVLAFFALLAVASLPAMRAAVRHMRET